MKITLKITNLEIHIEDEAIAPAGAAPAAIMTATVQSLENSNLLLVCKQCHDKFHSKRKVRQWGNA